MIILDLGLPGLDGVEVCRQIRTFSDCYLIMLTARTDEIDVLIGLSVGRRRLRHQAVQRPRTRGPGADDAATPAYRRSRRPPGAEVRRSWRWTRTRAMPGSPGTPVDLTPTEFDLLAVLSERPRLAFSRHQLIETIWGDVGTGDEHLVDVHIANLRRKLGDAPAQQRYIVTVRGVGYRMGQG